jgi:hypothetical protein
LLAREGKRRLKVPGSKVNPMRRESGGVGNRTILDMINFWPPGAPITVRRALKNVLQVGVSINPAGAVSSTVRV